MKRPMLFAATIIASGVLAISAYAFGLGDLNKALDTVKKVQKTAEPAGKVVKGLVGIGPEEERAIGESVALEIIGKYGGLVRDPAVTRRVNLVGRSLAYYSSSPALAWKFGVLNSPSVNGFSAPGGLVFITRGLYDLVGSDDSALAAVLAHEIAHITGRHALNIIERNEGLAGATNLVAQRSGDVAALQAQLSQFDLGIDKILKTLLETGFDPQTEFGADKSGRELALTVGYAPGALRAVLTQLQQKNGTPQAVFSTHPPLSERIQRLPADPAS